MTAIGIKVGSKSHVNESEVYHSVKGNAIKAANVSTLVDKVNTPSDPKTVVVTDSVGCDAPEVA